jgi:hypothetical protein
MSVSAVSHVNRGFAYAAMSELRSDRAQLLADIAAGADAQIIAADKLNVTSTMHRVNATTGRLDTLA